MNLPIIILMSVTIQTGPDIGSDRAVRGGKFLPWQVEHILSDVRYRAVEKAVQVGFTWGDAFKQVRKRLLYTNRDYLFSTKDEQTAFEYIRYCANFCEVFNLTKSVLTQGVDVIKVPVYDENGRATRVTEEVKVASIKFDTGSRIRAFSSNPNAVRSFPGDVGWDEAAFARNASQTYAAMQGRLQWGYDWGIWSSHNGDATLFCDIIDHAAESEDWEFDSVDIYRAIREGLVEKINETRGTDFTREAFLADCKARARFGSFEQEYELKRQGNTESIVPIEALLRCEARDYGIDRAHIGGEAVGRLFGEPDIHSPGPRIRKIQAWTKASLPSLFDGRRFGNRRLRLGFDVAASGQGHLGCFYIEERANAGGPGVLRGLITTRTEDWQVLKWILWTLLAEYPGEIKGAGDETGLGRQICWETMERFAGRFIGVNFSREKHIMGAELMLELDAGLKRWPRSEADIRQDYYAIKKTWGGGKWIFTEGKNNANPESHCDIAWAGALASAADQRAPAELSAITLEA